MPAQPHYHLAGVAGTGMNSIAQALLAAGYRVTGSDRYFDAGDDVPIIAKLQAAGVTFFPQDGTAIQPGTTGLVISTAIEADNPELQAAQQLGISQLHRSEMLAQLVEGQQCIAIAGTSGKTTTTGMLGYVLEALGLDPTVINGGTIVNWANAQRIGNVRIGRSPWWVIEADESDKSLLNYTPDWAVITTISIDHFDLEETIALFRNFAQRVKKGIVCGPGVKQHLEGATEAALLEIPETPLGFAIRMPGKHNQTNAQCTALLATQLGGHPTTIQTALAQFEGIERRLQRIGNSPIPVYDDFGHNPEKIAAAIQALSPGHSRVLACWKPHGYGPLKTMADEICLQLAALSQQCSLRIYVLPVYYAGGTTSRALESDAFVEQLVETGVDAHYAPDYASLEDTLVDEAGHEDVIVSMGARDPELPRFAQRVSQRLDPTP